MTDDQVSDITMLYRTAINEFQNNEIQELNLEFYRILSKFIGKIKTEEYSGIEAKIKNKIFERYYGRNIRNYEEIKTGYYG